MVQLFEDKLALVTGGSSGIGQAACIAFAREGADVAFLDFDEQSASTTIEKIKATGSRAYFFHCDVSKEEEVTSAFEKVKDKLGVVDAAFNNAGTGGEPPSRITEKSTQNLNNILNTNLKGIYFCLREELNMMLEKGGGAIVNASSVAGLVGFPGISHYTASKHGVIGLTKNAALEYAKENIRVNAISPGPINTPMIKGLIGENDENKDQILAHIPMGRLGEPEEVAETVIWLCSEKASYITGQVIGIEGGMLAQ